MQEIYNIAKAKGYVLPIVFQGLYSPVNRSCEEWLFSLLRELGIAVNVYSPLAGGFLVKTKAYVQDGQGRFSKDIAWGLYDKLYNHETNFKALEEWGKIAEDEGVTRAALAYRWVVYHSILVLSMEIESSSVLAR